MPAQSREETRGWFSDGARHYAAEGILERQRPWNLPEETIIPYEEFETGDAVYYFTPGGFLYRKDPGSEEVGDFFCGFLINEAWRYRIGG